jgi:outer membrane protein TolC
MASKRLRIGGRVAGVLLAIVLALSPQGAAAETLKLQPLIAEALANNRELRAAESRIAAAGFRITQTRGLPDPMVSTAIRTRG